MSLGMRIAASTSSQRHAGQIALHGRGFHGGTCGALAQGGHCLYRRISVFSERSPDAKSCFWDLGREDKSPQSFPASSGKNTNGL
eukprot:3697703-Heterocapsa_arctica.AAC.1